MVYELNDILQFGKHEGRKINDIICDDGLNYLSIEKYLKSCFDFLSQKHQSSNIWASDFFIDKDCYNALNKTERTLSQAYEIFKNIEVESGLIFLFSNSEESKKLFDVIIAFLKSDFEPLIILSYDNDFNKKLIPDSLNIRPDYGYINWAINNVSNFKLSANAINQTFNCNSLLSFEVIPFNINKYNSFTSHVNFIGYNNEDIVIEYKPIFRNYKYSFSDQIIEINNNKMVESVKKGAKRFFEKPYRKNDYTQYGRPEINGQVYDEDTINDAFEGDPMNAWNID